MGAIRFLAPAPWGPVRETPILFWVVNLTSPYVHVANSLHPVSWHVDQHSDHFVMISMMGIDSKKKKKGGRGGDSGRNIFQTQRNVFCLLPCIKDPEAKRNRLLVEEHEESLKGIPWDTGKFSSLSEFRCMGVLILWKYTTHIHGVY